jgi:putative transcriptional regulator
MTDLDTAFRLGPLSPDNADAGVSDGAELMARAVAASPSRVPPGVLTHTHAADLLDAPAWPFDLDSVSWEEPFPGLRFHLVAEDKARGVRKALVWAKGGARSPRHSHAGDEVILVLDGVLRDHTGDFHAGQICHTRKGETHSEEVPEGTDCVCFVVYYGDLIPLA